MIPTSRKTLFQGKSGCEQERLQFFRIYTQLLVRSDCTRFRIPLHHDSIPALIDELAYLLIGAPVEPTTKTTIQNFVANNTYFPYTTPTNQQMRDRVRAIIHLILTSAEFAVQK